MNALPAAADDRVEDLSSEGLGAEELAALSALAEEIVADHDQAAGELEQPYDAALWHALASAGLTRLDLPVAHGGDGAGLGAAMVVLSACAARAARVPVAEDTVLASWLLAQAGVTVPKGPVTVAVGDTVCAPDGTVSGPLERVPWARDAAWLAVLSAGAGDAVVHLVSSAAYAVTPGANVAREPRDGVVLDGAPVEASGRVPLGVLDELRLRGALARAVQLAAATSRAVALTVQHVGEREQFGRPLARLQAVQQQLALAAAESAAATAAVDAAVAIAAREGVASDRASFAVAVAKARAGAAATAVAGMAHQLHGAIGFTLDHQLRLVTTRLWAWSGEFGSSAEWNAVVGRRAAAAGTGLWRQLTSWS